MKVLTRIADEIHHTRRVYRNHDRLIAAEADYANATDPTNRAVTAEQIAFLIEHQIEHLEASRLARATSSLPVDVLRDEMATWKARAEEAWAEAAANTNC